MIILKFAENFHKEFVFCVYLICVDYFFNTSQKSGI